MTRTFRLRAASISSLTKSAGSSRRRPPLVSVTVNQFSPMSARRTSHEPTALVMTSTKSSPSWIESTSLKTWPPNLELRRSYSQPAG